ncbi:MAG: serine/threonine-protein phosphatase [Ignavibacteriaceae bacterium]|nr:serine/threonine-protein phosphatase [Ignavibacteriaceae bacterium]
MKSSIESANKFVYEKSNGNLNFKGMATTCEVLLINKTTAYWGHIGDSRIYFSKNGKLTQLTKDHSLIQKLIDDGALSFSETKNHPKKNVIMKAIGDEALPEIDTSKMLLPTKSKMRFMVCTDGVTSVLGNDELEKLFQYSLGHFSEQLSRIIVERGAPDNFTYVIVGN